jgi:hypothetical protein
VGVGRSVRCMIETLLPAPKHHAPHQRRFLELKWPTPGAVGRVEARKGWTTIVQQPL